MNDILVRALANRIQLSVEAENAVKLTLEKVPLPLQEEISKFLEGESRWLT